MPKQLPEAVVTQMDAAQKRPVILFELGLSSTLRYALYKSNITFPTGSSNVYTSKAIKVNGTSQSLEGQIQRIVIDLDNVSRDMFTYIYNEDFRNKSLIIKRIYLDAMGDASYYDEVFNGVMENPTSIGRRWVTISAVAGKSLNRKTLKFAYQKLCPYIFGGTECNTNGNADLSSLTASGTVDSGNTITLVDNTLTQIDDYWDYGKIEITKDSKTYYRKVKDFVASTNTITFDVELPVSVDNTCTYIVYKGCDKTWDTCSGINAWGPSADNSLNFGGCIHIGIDPIAIVVPATNAPPVSTNLMAEFDASNASPPSLMDEFDAGNAGPGGPGGGDDGYGGDNGASVGDVGPNVC